MLAMDWLFKDILMAIIIGLVSSYVFLLMLSRMRPRIEVSPWLHRSSDARPLGVNDGLPTHAYRVKIRNRARAPIVDIRAQLQLIRVEERQSGLLFVRTAVKRPKSKSDHSIFSLGKYDPSDPETQFLYRYTFEFAEPLEKLLEDNPRAFVRFRLFGRHATSGYGALIERRFGREAITPREFKAGNTLEVA